MSRSQQIIAIHDAVSAGRSPVDAIRAEVEGLSEGPPPAFIAVDVRHPYPMGDLGPPDWLVAVVAFDEPASAGSGWRRVLEAAPQQTGVILLYYGEVPDVPRSVDQRVDLAGWHGDRSDRRIVAVARRMVRSASPWSRDDPESDALRRGALIHVGDGTTMLNPRLLDKVDDLGLSTATLRILRNDNIVFLGDLVQRTEAELLRFPDLGRKRLGEIRDMLHALGLGMGATIPGWPPEDIEAAMARSGPAEILARTPQVPSGEMFRTVAGGLAIDPAAGGLSDREMGASTLSIQLQAAIRRKLETLSPITARLGNQPGWQGLSPLCERISSLLDRPGADVPDVLGSLYGAALELGSFADMDDAVRAEPGSNVEPLDPSARRPLHDVLAAMAPWLRRFPTIRELDDDAGRFLVSQAPSRAARDAIETAAAVDLLGDRDAAHLTGLLDAAGRGGFVSGKAGRRGVLSARNLVILVAGIVVNGLWDAAISEYAAHSIVARRAGAMLVQAEKAVLDIASELPSDVRIAVTRAVADSRLATGAVPGPKSGGPPPMPNM